jgi:hypothetical protein
MARVPHLKTCTHSVPFLNKKDLEIETFETASGYLKKGNIFATLDTILNDKAHKQLALVFQKDAEQEEREAKMNKEI